MVLRASSNELLALLQQSVCKPARVLKHLLLVGFVLGCGGLLQGCGEGCDGVVVGAALEAREHCAGRVVSTWR